MHFEDNKVNIDADYGASANLIVPLKEKYCAPEFSFEADSGKVKPKIIFVGDSYVWTWIHGSVLNNA